MDKDMQHGHGHDAAAGGHNYVQVLCLFTHVNSFMNCMYVTSCRGYIQMQDILELPCRRGVTLLQNNCKVLAASRKAAATFLLTADH